MADRAKHILDRNKEMRRHKEIWNTHYQLIGEYIMLRKQQFTTDLQPGEFLTDQIFDTTAIDANEKMGALLLGALWPNGARSFRYLPVDNLPDTDEIRKYFADITRIAGEMLDDTNAGLAISLEEYMRDQGGFGTSGIGLFEEDNDDNPLLFKAWDVKGMALAEGRNGRIDTVFNEEEKTVRAAVLEYGIDNVSKNTREAYLNGNTEERVRILHAIQPRAERDPFKFGNKDMPVASIHLEVKTRKILKESGFEEMPIFVTRFTKAMKEVYGRSPAMRALPDILELNTIWEVLTIAIEKLMDPPLAMYEDGTFGGGIVDTSPGAVNVVSVSSRISATNPIWPIQTVGDIRPTEALVVKLEEAISKAFMLDRLLDLNNETRMTAFEAGLRNQMRGESIGSIYKRQETELFTPMLERVFRILLKRGFFGVRKNSDEELEALGKGDTPLIIPEEVAELMMAGKNFYKIQYISPAQRIMQAEEAQGILTTFSFAADTVGVAPEAIDNIDVDGAVRRLAELTGIPTDIIRASDKVDELRTLRAEQQAQLAEIEKVRAASEIGMNFAQAQAMGQKTDQNLSQ